MVNCLERIESNRVESSRIHSALAGAGPRARTRLRYYDDCVVSALDSMESDALTRATQAFVDALREAAARQSVPRGMIAHILDVKLPTVADWLNHYKPPDLARCRRSTDMSVNSALHKLEQECRVEVGSFVSLYKAVEEARTQKRQSRLSTKFDDYLGVTRLHPSFPTAKFAEKAADAATIKMLNTWYPNLSAIERSLRTALDNGGQVEATLLNPFCRAAVTRASTLGRRLGGEAFYSVTGFVRSSLDELATIAKRSDHPEGLRVFAYPEVPALAIYQAGSYILAGIFLHGRLAVDGPQLEISTSGSVMAADVAAELDRVRAASIGPVPLDSWEDWLNAHL